MMLARRDISLSVAQPVVKDVLKKGMVALSGSELEGKDKKDLDTFISLFDGMCYIEHMYMYMYIYMYIYTHIYMRE